MILNRGDVVLVQGSNLLCRFERDQIKLVCMLTNSNGPLPHSWGTSMNIDGAVEVFQFDADGKSTTTKKFRRLLEGVAAPGRIYRLKVGDRYQVSSTRIACRVKRGNSSFGRSPVVHCYYITPKTIKTTREFVIDNFFCQRVLRAAHAERSWDNSRCEAAGEALRREAASTRVNNVLVAR